MFAVFAESWANKLDKRLNTINTERSLTKEPRNQVKQAWISDDGKTFDTEAECRGYENDKREFLEAVITYILQEADGLKAYPDECLTLLQDLGVKNLADNILHLENFCSLVADLREQWEHDFSDWKYAEDGGRTSFWPEERWMEDSWFKEYPLTKGDGKGTSARSASSVYNRLRF